MAKFGRIRSVLVKILLVREKTGLKTYTRW